MLSKYNAHISIEIVLGHALKRIEELNEPYTQCLFEEYKEWIEGFGDKGIGQDAIVFKYIGNIDMNQVIISMNIFNQTNKFKKNI